MNITGEGKRGAGGEEREGKGGSLRTEVMWWRKVLFSLTLLNFLPLHSGTLNFSCLPYS